MIGRRFLWMVGKNFKLLVRSRASALIVIFGPLLVILLLGLAFDNTNAYALNIGVYADSYTDTINSFVDKLAEKDFNVVKVNVEEDCPQRIKEGALHSCIVFPPGFSMTGENRKNEIEFYVDYSRVNMVYLILETLTSKISLRSKEISMELTNTLLTSLEKTRVEVFNKKPMLASLIEKNTKASTDVAQISLDLGTLDFDVSIESVGLSALKNEITDGNTTVAVGKIDSARSKINTARGVAGTLEGGESIVSDLDSAYSILGDAKNMFGDLNSSAALALIEKATDQLELLQNKMVTAAAATSAATGAAASVTGTLSESLESLNAIKTSFDNIDNYIGSIQISEADEIVSPIKTSIKAVSSETTHLNLLFPSLIVLVVMFVSILLATTLVMMEKHSPAYFRNFIAPVHDFWFVMSTYFTNIVIVLFQVVIIIAISVAFFSADLLAVALEASVALLLIVSAFTFIGMFIGYVFNSEETGTLAAISVGSLFLLLSNLIIPLESVPEAVRQVLQWNPFVYGEVFLRKIVIYQQPLSALQDYIVYFAALSVVLFCIVMLISVIGRKRFIASFDKESFSFFGFLKHKPKTGKSDDAAKTVHVEKSKKKKGLFKYL